MESQEQLNALYNPQVEVKEITTNYTDYRPSAKKGKNNVYQAIIRFVPWWEDAKHGSIRDKWACWLVDPLTERGKNVDCPSSIGKPSVLQDMYFKCKGSDNALLQSKHKIFSRRHVYSSLIQIIKDDNNPELAGEIKLWKYGVKIHDKIDAMLKPAYGEKDDPFDILQGKAFLLVITLVSGYNNYDQSKFLDKMIPLLIPDADKKLVPITQSTDKQVVFDFVKEKSAHLPEFGDFKEWDQETHEYVNSVIVQVTGEAVAPSNYAAVSNAKTDDSMGSVVESGITSSELKLDDLNVPELAVGGNLAPSAVPVADPLADLDIDLPELEKPAGVPGGGITGDLDDVLKDL